MKKIAVIGSGISGNAAAWALSKDNDVTLFEKEGRAGGHSNTVEIDYFGRSISVDTGFIVYNDHNYPLLTKLFDHLGVETTPSNMSFGVSLDQGRFEWSGSGLRGVFAQKMNLFSPGFLFMLKEIFKFNRICKEDLKSGALCGTSFAEYLANRKFSKRLKDDYLVPMTAAIWSTPPQGILDFPAESMVRFMDNHRLIHKRADRPKWRTVKGGSRNYVNRLLKDFDGTLLKSTGIASVVPNESGAIVTRSDGKTEQFDEVVIAAHSDEALAMLPKASKQHREILGSIPYKANMVYLHRDEKLMPKRRGVWSAWNYLGSRTVDGASNLSVTYWMNRLQNIDNSCPLFISLNPDRLPDPDKTFRIFSYNHPQFDQYAIKAQDRLAQIQGDGHIWFCGAWTRYGFHEDGLASGLAVAKALGSRAPFEKSGSDVGEVPKLELAG